MRTIALISCGKSKRRGRAPAHQLYTGDLFQKSLAYARHIKADAIYILSARYGLLDLAQEIDYYDETLKGMSSADVARWAEVVLERLQSRTDLTTDRFVVLAGKAYRSQLVRHFTNVKLPLARLRIGEQLKFLKAAVA